MNRSLLHRLVLDTREAEIPLIPGQETRLDALRNLAVLRVVAPLLQLITVAGVDWAFGIQTMSPLLMGVFAVQILVAALSWAHVLRRPRVRVRHVVANGLLDILMFDAVLYCTGGAANPFSVLVVLPYLIIASALAPQWVVFIAASAVAGHLLLAQLAPGLTHPDGMAALHELHVQGSIVAFVLAALLLTFFINRLNTAVRRNETGLREALELQTRNESVTAMGALAAGYAHEISSPLGTMSLIVEELLERHAASEDVRDLKKLDEQLRSCKDIISNLAQAGGQRRSESAGAIRADLFVLSILDRVRNLHAGATLTPVFDPSPAPMIVGEETLRQAVTNVVENALQASPHHVQVQTHWSDRELRITVRDRGPGFASEILQQFGMTVRTTRRDIGGNGMGLMLASATLDYLNGRLTLSNDPHGGACVCIEVPLATIGISLPGPRAV
jgi:two-component system, sensor histidine kinase RegB